MATIDNEEVMVATVVLLMIDLRQHDPDQEDNTWEHDPHKMIPLLARQKIISPEIATEDTHINIGEAIALIMGQRENALVGVVRF